MANTFNRSVAGSSAGAVSSTVTTINGTARPRLVYPLMEKLDYIKTPFTDLIKKGEAFDNPKMEWSSEVFRPLTITSDTAGYAASGAVVTINLLAGDGAKVMKYDIYKNGVTSEYFMVTDISTDALTVVRAVGGTTVAAVPAAATTFTRIGQAVIEHIDSPQGILSRGELTYNNVQMWDHGITISYLQNNSNNSYLIQGKEYNSELKRQLIEIKRSAERTFIRGKRGDASGITLPYMMGGLLYFTTVNATAKSGAYMAESDFLTITQQAWENVGPGMIGEKVMAGIFAKQVFSSWVDNARRADFSTKRVSTVVDSYETDTGIFEFVPSYDMPADEIVGFNPRDLSRHPYAGMDWTDEPQARSGMQEVGHVYGAYTLRAPGDRARWKITGFSTTRADYPSLVTA